MPVKLLSYVYNPTEAASKPQYRDTLLHIKRQTTVPANTPCSSTCSPFLTAATPCNGATSCLCTTTIYQELQSCVTCLGNAGGSTVATDIESAAQDFNQKCAGAVPSVTIPLSAAAKTGIPDSSDAGGFSAGGGFGASSDGSDFNTFSDDSFNTDGGTDASPTVVGGFGSPATAGITIGEGAATPATNANPFAPAAATAKAGSGGTGTTGSSGSGSGNSGSGNAPGSAQGGGASQGKSAGYQTVRTPSMQYVENGVALVVTMALLLNL